ncbi:hypothetical protein C5Z25_07195 [Lactobacillus sp. CBA3605]|uniref:PucR family transcriptional regulator n=1 Tax=Lactobacillus sp. CBA3605 TaxID=2099788 RepID=UPI000CFCBCA0|nr:PucR family transcriptional regulator [Lactobacillus sp. CBA3605]AVK61568.1 hypothetical protein C5Z25_07195 [Lactobacillus sp. CBA3605]
MKLKQVIQRLAAKFEVTTSLTTATAALVINQAQFENKGRPPIDAQTLLLQLPVDQQVRLSCDMQGSWQVVATIQLGPKQLTVAQTQNQLLKLLFMLGQILQPVTTGLTTLNDLAIDAITADFDPIFDRAVRLVQNPLAIIDLNGQVLSRSHMTKLNGASIQAAVGNNQIGRWLLERGFAPEKLDFLTQIYVASDQLSAVPMLVTPLAHRQEPLGYLVMPALTTPLNTQHALLINSLSKIIAGSLVKNQIMTTAASQRDRLLNMLLTERQSATFDAQFKEQNAKLPTEMVLIKCEPLAEQAPMILQQRLQYLLRPLFAQSLISVYRQHCLALVTISLAAYNSLEFKAQLQQITKQADCRLIVSNYYNQPEDTAAAYLVCSRTAKLKTIHSRVVFCEDEFYNLALARVNHIEILPFFVNPALKALISYDAKNKTTLVPTLDAYLVATCNLTRTAKKLYVHPNTLRNRLKAITTITGCDLRDAETCFKLASGFKLQRFLIDNNDSLATKSIQPN